MSTDSNTPPEVKLSKDAIRAQEKQKKGFDEASVNHSERLNHFIQRYINEYTGNADEDAILYNKLNSAFKMHCAYLNKYSKYIRVAFTSFEEQISMLKGAADNSLPMAELFRIADEKLMMIHNLIQKVKGVEIVQPGDYEVFYKSVAELMVPPKKEQEVKDGEVDKKMETDVNV